MFEQALLQDLKELSKEQTKEIIEYLSKESLKELRQKQNITECQIKLYFRQKNILALNNLYIMKDYLTYAISLKEFGHY
jgi:ssRNA-specific RNase YbeY (16S rRNA maturation enzyme)